MSKSERPTNEPRFRIRDFRRGRELSALALLAVATVWAIAVGLWAFVPVLLGLAAFQVANIIRRSEWNGRPIVNAMTGPSTFEEGWRVAPRDILTLTFIIVASLVNALVLGLTLRPSPIWFISVGLAVVISIVASIMLIRELRRRSKSDEAA